MTTVCTLAIYVRQFADLPVVVAANRDEFLSRPAKPPLLLADNPRVVGGLDLEAKGTWLGISEHGVVAGLLNRRTAEPPVCGKRSRGLIPLAVLSENSAAAATRALTRIDPDAYNAFSLLVADRESAWVAQNRNSKINLSPLEKGLHLITNLDVDDSTCPRIARSHRLFVEAGREFERSADSARFRGALRDILAQHTTVLDPRLADALEAICVHAGEFATRSSALVFLGTDGRWQHWFADGPPCRTAHLPALCP